MGGISAAIVAVAFLVLPGIAIGAAARMRGPVLWGAAPAVTLGFVGVAALVYTRFSFPWTPPAVLAGLIAVCMAGSAVTALLRRRRPWWFAGAGRRDVAASRGWWAASACVVVAATVVGAIVLVATRGLTEIPQGWDSLLHGFTIRWIEQTHTASPFTLAGASEPANAHYYYPDAFHAVGALLLQLPGMSVPVAYNAVVAAIGPVFVVGSAALMHRIDPRPFPVAAAAVLAASIGTFPVLLDGRGPVTPFALSAALIPGACAALLTLLRRPGFAPVIVLGIGVSGMYVTHPAGAAAGLLVMALVGLSWCVWGGRSRSWASAGGVLAAAVIAVVVTYPSVEVSQAGAMEDFTWPVTENVTGGLLSAVSFPLVGNAQWGLTAVLTVGAVASRRHRGLRPFVGAVLVFVGLYVVSATSSAHWAQLATMIWWNDKYRFLGLIAVVAVPVVAGGLTVLADGHVSLRTRLRARGRDAPACGWRATDVVLMLTVVGLLAGLWAPRFTGTLNAAMYSGWPAVTDGERDVYGRLAQLYDGGTVMNDPFDGSPWLYSLETIPVVMPGSLGPRPTRAMGRERMDLYSDLHSYGYAPPVGRAIRDLDVRWVIMGGGSVADREAPPGFAGLDANPRFTAVIRTPAATVWRVQR